MRNVGYKVVETRLLRLLELECNGFEFCPEVTAKVLRLGLAIHEVAIQYHPRSYSQGKKIHFADWIMAVRTLWKYRHWGACATTANAGWYFKVGEAVQGPNQEGLRTRSRLPLADTSSDSHRT